MNSFSDERIILVAKTACKHMLFDANETCCARICVS